MPLRQVQKRGIVGYKTLCTPASRFCPPIRLRPLASQPPVRALHKSTPTQEEDRPRDTLSARPYDRQDKDVIPSDLTATLAAHRASNLASIIRNVEATTASRPWKTIELPHEDVAPQIDSNAVQPDRVVSNEEPTTSAADSGPSVEERHREQGYKITKISGRELRPSQERRPKQKVQSNPRRPKEKVPVNPRARWKPLKELDKDRKEARAQREAAFDYAVGRHVSPIAFRDKTVYSPWLTPEIINTHDLLQRLDDELQAFSDWITLTPEELAFRNSIEQRITQAIRTHTKDIKLETFGSHRTGLASPLSDIDIGFHLPSLQKDGERGPSPLRPAAQKQIQDMLRTIGNATILMKDFVQRETVRFSRYPLFRMIHGPTQLEVQIVSSKDHTVIIQTVENYLSEYPQLRTIYMVLKETLAARELDDARMGGLPSYALLNMIVVCFKLENISKTDSLGRCLRSFLRFYSAFEPSKHCLSVDPPSKHRKRNTFIVGSATLQQRMREDPRFFWRMRLSVEHEKQTWLLSVQDPADMTNDMTKATLRIMDILKTLGGLQHALELWLAGNAGHDKGYSPLFTFFGKALGRIRVRRDATKRFLLKANAQLALGGVAPDRPGEESALEEEEEEEDGGVGKSAEGDEVEADGLAVQDVSREDVQEPVEADEVEPDVSTVQDGVSGVARDEADNDPEVVTEPEQVK